MLLKGTEKKAMNIRMEKKVLDKIEKMAIKRKISVGALIREFINEKLAKK